MRGTLITILVEEIEELQLSMATLLYINYSTRSIPLYVHDSFV